jgi:predicted  nucleic acid-binding Zn-ribbon protein
MKKDLFNLQLENHFLKDRLANTTDEHFRAMHNENVKLKLEVVNYAKEIKRLKKIILQQDRGLKDLQRQLDDLAAKGNGRGGGDPKDKERALELEGLWREEKHRRKELEMTVKQLGDEQASSKKSGEAGDESMAQMRDQLDDAEASEKVWRERCEALEEEVESAKATAEDQAEEMERLRDEADRAVEEVEKMKANGLNESVGLGRGREAKLTQRIADLEGVSDTANQRTQTFHLLM